MMGRAERDPERLRAEAKLGRKWEITLEALREFCETQKGRLVGDIALHHYDDTEQLKNLAARLETLTVFQKSAEAYIEQGRLAENKLREDEA